MVFFLKSRMGLYEAKGEFDIGKKRFTVKKGSRVSDSINKSPTFRGANMIEKYREEYVRENIVIKDVSFKSASTAACFVTGNSTNGHIAWKDKEGRTYRAILGDGK